MKTLLVDDDLSVRKLLMDYLVMRGCEVTISGDGLTALQLYQQNKYPLILTDMMMPKIDGVELCRRIRNLPQGNQAYILVITAYGSAGRLKQLLDAGANDYITKPLELKLLDIRLQIAKQQVKEQQKRFQTENELKYNKAFLEHLIDQIPEPIFVKNEEHQWILLNDACSDFLGHPKEELIGKSEDNFFSQQQAEASWKKEASIFATGISHESEELFPDTQGNQHLISIKRTVFESTFGKKALISLIRAIKPK